jgi:hypothetical protein
VPRRLFAALAVFLAHAPAYAGCDAQQAASLPMTLWQDKLLLPVGINGSAQTIALDTGAGISTISTAVANSIDLPHDFDHAAQIGGVGGRESIVNIGQVDAFDLDRLHFTHMIMPIADMTMKTPRGEPVAGLLGAEILRRFDVEIDIPAGRLTFWRPSTCPDVQPPWTTSGDPIPFDLDEGNHILVPLKIGGVTLTGVLDTGSGGLAITASGAYRAGVTDDDLEQDIRIHGTGVNERAWTGHLHRFEALKFGGIIFRGMEAEIVPSNIAMRNDALIGADALIGMPLLQQMRLYISYRTKTLFMQPSGRDGAD